MVPWDGVFMSQLLRRRVVVTGIGAVSPNGVGAERFADACRQGVSGLRRPQGINLGPLKTSAVGRWWISTRPA